LEVSVYERGVGTHGPQRSGHHPLRLGSPYDAVLALKVGVLGSVLIPVAHELVDAPPIKAAGDAAYVVREVDEQLVVGSRDHQLALVVSDVPVEGLHHAVHESCHNQTSPRRALWGAPNRSWARSPG